jgi:hypothetical protein
MPEVEHLLHDHCPLFSPVLDALQEHGALRHPVSTRDLVGR